MNKPQIHNDGFEKNEVRYAREVRWLKEASTDHPPHRNTKFDTISIQTQRQKIKIT